MESNTSCSEATTFQPTEQLASQIGLGPPPSSGAEFHESEVDSSFQTRHDPKQTIAVATIVWLTGIHACALAAPWTFTWEALVATVILHWFCGSIGICLGYHRLLTHGSFKTTKMVRRFFAVAGTIAGEGSPLDWVADHRKHHAHSDKLGDPHSPEHGALWSHMLWLARRYKGQDRTDHVSKWAPDLWKDDSIRVVDKLFIPINVAVAIALMGIGYAIGGMEHAVSFLIWGTFLRLVLVLHTTWFVNSASHMWGYRNYETADKSRNLWWVGLLAYGEGWHNNHHAYPRMAVHGHRWWEIDMTYWAIRFLRVTGLAWDVVDYKQKTAN